MSIFFDFYDHLLSRGFSSQSAGFLLSVFSLISLPATPLLSSFITMRNVYKAMLAGAIGIICSFQLYPLAETYESLLLLRLFHGLSFTFSLVAVLTALVNFIPPAQSGRAFGLFSLINLLPHAFVPLSLEKLMAYTGNHDSIFIVSGAAMVFMLIPAALLAAAKPAGGIAGRDSSSLTIEEIKSNLKSPPFILVLLTTLLAYSCYFALFYNVNGYGETLQMPEIGFFFTILTTGMIAIRLLAANLLDKTNKAVLSVCCCFVLAALFFLMRFAGSPAFLYTLGGFFGLILGVLFPLLSALVFDLSLPRFRAFNANLSAGMVTGGFFLGTLASGLILEHHNYAALFTSLFALMLLSALLMLLLAAKRL
jgi:predicted MFS family arabinose efflux permease